MNNDRISLRDDLQYKWFTTAMGILARNKGDLTPYDRDLWQDLNDGHSLVWRDLTITRKQMNHIKQVASEIEQGKY